MTRAINIMFFLCLTPSMIFADEDPFVVAANRLMAEKGVALGSETAVCKNWRLPKDFELSGKRYVTTGGVNGFAIFPCDDQTNRLASGRVRIHNNERECREKIFFSAVFCSLPWRMIRNELSVSEENNGFVILNWLLHRNEIDYRHNLLYKNINVEIYAPSNGVEFAKAIFEVGLKNGNEDVVIGKGNVKND